MLRVSIANGSRVAKRRFAIGHLLNRIPCFKVPSCLETL
ncbi:MAG: hypothetical protein OJF58_004506 [Enhydrobacter sp.]|nr:MAG: hypothetical protein OJF58_004506 [Enhydrobacter sp.]